MRSLIVGVVFCCALSSSLLADFELCLSTGNTCMSGDYVIVASNGTSTKVGVTGTSALLAPGTIDFIGAVGTYNISVTDGSQTGLILTIGGSENSISAAGDLNIFLSENSITTPIVGWSLTFSGSLTSTGGAATVEDSAYGSTSNTFFAAGTTIASLGPYSSGSPGTFAGFATGPTLSGLRSITNEISLMGNGATGLGLVVNPLALDPVPEPLSVILFGTVIVICASMLRRNLKARG